MFSRLCLISTLLMLIAINNINAEELKLHLRKQVETAKDSGRYHTITSPETWNPEETALIVCDVWDAHHCLNAVRRMEQFLPRLDDVLKKARAQGVTIIHAPSDCMATYADHPARQRAISTPKASKLPADIGKWCSIIPAEEAAAYPIDQSDGGEDDDPAEHAEWAAKLKAQGRNPKLPWKAQHPAIAIDKAKDFISDKGDEVWSILETRGIKNVILAGVHTNMCVLGRPFGLRQMVKNGKNAVLMRDLTDTMYNPQRRPYVSHFTGTERIIDHIEQRVCPTITSDQFTGGKPFRFKDDPRPRLAIISAEDEYETEKTLPHFALTNLGHDFSIRFIFANDTDKTNLPGLEAIDNADLLLISVRRKPLKATQLETIQQFIRSGKPVVGIRTASHAFHLRTGKPPEGTASWPDLDAEVWGGSYTNHHANDLKSRIIAIDSAKDHPILTGVRVPFDQGGSLYKVNPLQSGAVPILNGQAEGVPAEPVAYTFTRKDGGRSFYTSLGHKADFENPAFVRMLVNALFWAAGREVPKEFQVPRSPLMKPGDWKATTWLEPGRPWLPEMQSAGTRPLWARCLVQINQAAEPIAIEASGNLQIYCNGVAANKMGQSQWIIPPNAIEAGELNLIVLRWATGSDPKGPCPMLLHNGQMQSLGPVWEINSSSAEGLAALPLPARFAAATDVISR